MSEAGTEPTGTVDRIVLTLPGTARLRGVATLVLGGIGSRLDLPYEKVDDLQLAVLSVLAANELDPVTIEVEVEPEGIAVSIGPLPKGGATDKGLLRVLERLVDAVEPPRLDAGQRGERITIRLDRHMSNGSGSRAASPPSGGEAK